MLFYFILLLFFKYYFYITILLVFILLRCSAIQLSAAAVMFNEEISCSISRKYASEIRTGLLLAMRFIGLSRRSAATNKSATVAAAADTREGACVSMTQYKWSPSEHAPVRCQSVVNILLARGSRAYLQSISPNPVPFRSLQLQLSWSAAFEHRTTTV